MGFAPPARIRYHRVLSTFDKAQRRELEGLEALRARGERKVQSLERKPAIRAGMSRDLARLKAILAPNPGSKERS